MDDDTNLISCEKVGTVSILMYKEKETGLPIFYVEAENENVLSVRYIIEDILSKF